MQTPKNLLYTKEHEWVRVEGDEATIGITNFAQEQLGDVVFVEIETTPESEEELEKEAILGTIEAVKTVSDLFMPLGGTILEINPLLDESPEVVNKDPYGEGWLVKIKISDTSEIDELLSVEAYEELI